MRKTYQMILALLLMAVGAMNTRAEEISLDEIPFWQHETWGVDEPKTQQATFLWVVGEPGGTVYGDDAVINFADLSAYTQLIITTVEGADGSARVLLNRDVDEGQWNENEAESHLIDNTKGGWSAKYFSQSGNVLTVDLKQLVKDKGYAHLHAIKGANWSNVTIESMVVVSQGKPKQVGWVDVINNGNLEGDDVSSFYVALDATNDGGYYPAEITDGVGVNESRGIMVTSIDNPTETWATQFFIKFNEFLPKDTRWRIALDYKADTPAASGTGCHGEPRAWQAAGLFDGLNFTTDWQTFTAEGTITEGQAGTNGLGSIAFDLNTLGEATNYYFDNIMFQVYKAGTYAEFSNDVILLDFGFDTNIPELVAASGSKRIFLPTDCATVKVKDKEQPIFSVEGLEDGRLYIFLESPVSDRDEVEVTFTNPSGQYHLTYTSGPNVGADVPNFNGIAENNIDIEENDGYPYVFVTPSVMSTDPEDGSFNLPNDISEFKVVFDKNVDCAALKATANNEQLGVSPATGFATEVTLTHSGSFKNGEYVIKLTNIYPEQRLSDEVYGTYTYTVNIGEVVIDPNDQPYDLIPADYFANTASGGIPEGFIVMFGEEERTSEGSYGSGPRMFDFGAGGDFTKGLYFREGFVEYGNVSGHELQMEAGKKYNIRFNTAMWKDSGSRTRFQVFDASGEAVMTQMIDNTPNVNGSYNAVSGSTLTEIKFVPEASGNYTLRWTSAADETSNPGFNEILLANVTCKYVPSALGLEETLLLNTALENAKTTLEENDEERYHGSAFDALSSAISKYDGQKWSSPSKYKEAADELDVAAQALKDHRAMCDEYDTQIKKALDVVRQNAEKKFAAMALYAELKALTEKYHGTSQWVNITGDDDDPEWELNYEYDVLTDDGQLATAIGELKTIANTTSLLFTEGESACSNTGVKVAIERLRLGAETLKALGAENDPLVAKANNALTDDDELADDLKLVITQLLYGQLKEAGNTLFEETTNEETLETVTPTYDMTVFVKNPNIYKLSDGIDFTDESVPGWTTPEGYNRPGLTWGWSTTQGTSEIAEDCMFQTWGSSYRVEQTITDLPAGVYTIKMGFGERQNSDEANFEDSYAFVYGSDGIEIPIDCPGIGQSYPVLNVVFEDVAVTDGELTIGVNAGPSSHTFFNDVRVVMTAPAAGFDYAKAYTNGIDDLTNGTAKVRNVALFDLNGRPVTKARQGVVLVKKQMSDGTIRTEKVVKK